MPILLDILVILGLSAAVLYLCHRLQVPVIVGFLVTGLLTGPYGFRLVGDIKAVTELSEIGIIALLFTIGLEFSFTNLLEIRRTALIGGTLQMSLTLAAAAGVAYALGQPWRQAVFIGFLTALSSTAIVMKLLQDRSEVETPQGVNALGILIYQDLIVVPMMILLPFLGGTAQVSQENIVLLLVKSAGVVLFTVAATRWVVPWILHRVTRTQSRELFLLTTVFICLAVASLTYAAGLSLALGAFLAGLVISDEYSHQAMGDILPFRDIFASFFFVSVGMLLDLGFLVRHPVYVAAVAGGILFLKALVATGSSLVVGLPLRASVLVGLAICQIGEFSFILAETGKSQGLLSGILYQEFLALSVLTMMATPFLFRFSPRIAEALTRLPLPRRWKRGTSHVHGAKRFHEKDHLVVIGFGMTGRNIAKAARETKIPYAVLDLNPDRVRDEREKGEPIFYGDATHEPVLTHVNIRQARTLAILINDAAAARRITTIARHLNHRIHIIVRTRFREEITPLMDLGASEVIPEEFEASVEIFSRILARYLLPEDEIHRFVEEIRSDGYAMFRNLSKHATSCPNIGACMPDMDLRSLRVHGTSALAGKTIAEAKLGSQYGVTVLAVRRDAEIFSIPQADLDIQPEDILFIVGPPGKIMELEMVLRGSHRIP